MNILEPRIEYLYDDRIEAAKASVELWLEEIRRAVEACKKAEKHLDAVVNKCFKEKGLKALEGEVIYLKDTDLLYALRQDQLFRLTNFGED